MILVEIRDLNTATTAVQASLADTSFSFCHQRCSSSVTRLINIGIEPFLVELPFVARVPDLPPVYRTGCATDMQEFLPMAYAGRRSPAGSAARPAARPVTPVEAACTNCWSWTTSCATGSRAVRT